MIESGIVKHDVALDHIFGGKSYVTFLNSESGNRFTFKVVAKDNIFFVNVLTSPDVYTYVGFYDGKNYMHSKKTKISIDSQSIRTFNYVINKLRLGKLSDFIEIYNDGKCSKCGKRLTTPESIVRGIGPECAKRKEKKK